MGQVETTLLEKELLQALGHNRQWFELMKNKTLDIAVGADLYNALHMIVEISMVENYELNQMKPVQSLVRDSLSRLWNDVVHETVHVHTPFHTDFGKHTIIGQHVFINKDVFFTDLGGICIENYVLIGPRTTLITVNHGVEPSRRRGLLISPIHIKENAWLGANVTVLPGVTIGENAVIGANSVVTKDVPPNTVVVGTPAKIVKNIE
ncbi:DapH/DapD/GlmU-related protein [Veillonella agrestimuris]|uniref:DapH/DapD/GlmU-related protein n=1 Tax=Veillonella agrestimuris TaxID=2941340 RepID=UPI00203DE668|nr:DapH/DapD/GlmU-related protein [Veillonella agrestimuris]